MSIIDGFGSLVKLIDPRKNMELYNHVRELQTEAMRLLEENRELKQVVTDLRAQLSVREELDFRDDAYWRKDGTGPFCSNCQDNKKTMVRMQTGATSGTFCCPFCGNSTWSKEYRGCDSSGTING